MTKITILMLIIAMTFTTSTIVMSIPAFADDTDRSQYYEEFEEPETPGFSAKISSLAANPCDSATQPNQCLYTPATSLPTYASAVLTSQSATPNAECGQVLIISSGNPNDADTTLSTGMGHAGCGTNPDGFSTFDCVDVTYTPSADSVILAYSSEYPEFQHSSFTDWMRVTGASTFINLSINSWPNPGTPTIPYGPSLTGTQTLGTISNGDTVTLRVADSGDSIYDTGLIVIPVACADNPQPLFCGDGAIQSALGEQCDDGNTVDGDGCSSICLLENSPPVAQDDTADTDEDTSVTIDVLDNDSDPDGNSLTVTIVTEPTHGTASVNLDGTIEYSPTANYNGPDSLVYEIDDGNEESDTATVSITVNPINDAPVANPDSLTIMEDAAPLNIDVIANDSDIDGDTLTITSIDTTGTTGTVTNNGIDVTYQPAPNFNGMDSFSYTIDDGNGGTATALVIITVTPVNDAPVCSTATTNTPFIWPPNHKMVSIGAAMTATDVDGDTVTVTVSSIFQDEPTNGLGDGDTSPDATLSPAQVRAERSGTGDGRVYVVTLTADDGNGGICNGSVQVIVPHSMKKPVTAVDSGAAYDSTTP